MDASGLSKWGTAYWARIHDEITRRQNGQPDSGDQVEPLRIEGLDMLDNAEIAFLQALFEFTPGSGETSPAMRLWLVVF